MASTFETLDATNYLWGALNPLAAAAGARHLGIFTDAVFVPVTFGTSFLDNVWGPSATYATAAATIGSTGGLTLYTLVTNRSRSPVMNAVFKLNQTADTLLYIGFYDTPWESGNPTPAGTNPLNARSGVALVIESGNFKVAHNNGSGVTVFDELPSLTGSSTTPADTNFHTLQIRADEPNARFVTELNKFSAYSPQSGLTLTADIPASTTPLVGCIVIETQAAASKQFVIHRWEMYC